MTPGRGRLQFREVFNHLVVLCQPVLPNIWMIREQMISYLSVLVFTSVKWSWRKLLLLEEQRRFFTSVLQPLGPYPELRPSSKLHK